jgi:Tol biopolymer transport system component
MSARRRLAAAFCVAALAAPALEAASFPPRFRFRSVSTPRVSVHFHQGHEASAREAAALATEILDGHEQRYGVKVPRVQMVLVDASDDPNGFATPFPYPLVQVRAVAPDGSDDFGNYESWLRLVLVHELAHVVHLEEARGLFRVGRKIFGRAPFLFPNVLTPTWMIEGLATYEETEGTSFGRGRNPDTRMLLRMAALDEDLPGEDRPVLGLDRWPGGQSAYAFGEAFLRDLSGRRGPDTLPELARVHSGRIIPFLDELTFGKVTGAGVHARWREWSSALQDRSQQEAARLQARGITESRPLTRRGIRQTSPRLSPDGEWVAYTSRSLTRFPAIRLVRRDGSEDRRLVDRNGGSALSWTPDGKQIVFDEREVHGTFAVYSDLKVVDVATGRVRRLSRGLRARDADVAPDGQSLVFARRLEDRSELYALGLDGEGLRRITESPAGTEWSSPRWSPEGRELVASRWTGGGWLDIVIVDPVAGTIRELTHDRARDVEPDWVPDGTQVVFRSDRDGISNLYAARVADGSLSRLTNVLGGAFSPDVGADGRTLVFTSYASGGYDVHIMQADLAEPPSAEAFADPYPPQRPVPAAVDAPDKPYRPLGTLLPRFWSPYLASADDEFRYGVLTAGADPLLRHAYGLAAWRGSDTGRLSGEGFYQYDRWRPTLQLIGEDEARPAREGILRTRSLIARVSLPLRRSIRSSQSLSLAWRRERQIDEQPGGTDTFDEGGLELGWTLGSSRRYPYSVSPVDGGQFRVAYLLEDPALGGDVSLGKLTADARGYLRAFGEADVLAVHVNGGTTFGRPEFRRSFAVGGFPEGGMFDLVGFNPAVLRGYPEGIFSGRNYAAANLEYRFPLLRPQAGWRTLPAFIRSLHAAVFADAAHAWSDEFRLSDVKTSAGAALGTDVYLAHAVPFTFTFGAAHGFDAFGETQVYFRLGLAF